MKRATTALGVLFLCGAACASGQTDGGQRVSKYDGMPQVLIPAGEFVMGADEEDAFGRRAEFPPHRVHLDAYWIDQHEVTNAQFATFLNEKCKGARREVYYRCDVDNPACRIECDADTGLCSVESGFEQHPVCAVSWYGAHDYALQMRRRLPTEAEWEKAARGLDQRRYPWGDDWAPKRTNTREKGPGRTAPVGSIEGDRSPSGVWDMAGNVREWVQDGWDEGYYLTSPPRNPVCETNPGRRVVRGGAWCLTEWDARTTSRQVLIGGAQRRYMGFRCAKTVPKPLPPPAKVSDDVLFYATMDGLVHAAAARGERRALEARKGILFVPGRRGQAALLGEDDRKRFWVDYDTTDNMRIEEGTVALWIQLRGWCGTDDGFRFFFMLRDETCCKFYLYRFIKTNVVTLAGNGVEGEWASLGMATAAWKDGQWVHLAVTWQDREIAMYVDGKSVGRTVMPPEKAFRGLPARFSLGQSQEWSSSQKRAQTAFDEFVIFSRALTPEEVVRERDRKGLP